MTVHVHHPTPGFTGPVKIQGLTLRFHDGRAEAPPGANLTAFRRAGHTIRRATAPAEPAAPEPEPPEDEQDDIEQNDDPTPEHDDAETDSEKE